MAVADDAGMELYIGTKHGKLLRVANAAPDASPAPRWGKGRGPPLVAETVALPKVTALGSRVRVAGVVATKLHLIVSFAQLEDDGVVVW